MDARDARDGIVMRPIGVLRSPFVAAAGTPIQPVYAQGAAGRIELLPEYEPALADLDGFERLWVVYWMDRVREYRPRVVPYRDEHERGLFATRSPVRPNPLGISVLRLVRRAGVALEVADVDVLDGTPVLDVKPYVPAFDAFPGAKAGWFDACGEDRRVADDRFHGGA